MFPTISPNGENGHKSILIFAVKRRLAPIARQHLRFRFSEAETIHLKTVATSDARDPSKHCRDLRRPARQGNSTLCRRKTAKRRDDSQAPLGLRQQEKGTGGWAGMGGREGEGQGNEKVRWHSHFAAAVSSRGAGREENKRPLAVRGRQR